MAHFASERAFEQCVFFFMDSLTNQQLDNCLLLTPKEKCTVWFCSGKRPQTGFILMVSPFNHSTSFPPMKWPWQCQRRSHLLLTCQLESPWLGFVSKSQCRLPSLPFGPAFHPNSWRVFRLPASTHHISSLDLPMTISFAWLL